MPFIACLNNVKTTHKRNTTSPPPNQRGRPDQNIRRDQQGIPATPIIATRHPPTHTPPTPPPHKAAARPGSTRARWKSPSHKDARVHYADLKQQPHQHHAPTNRWTRNKGGQQKHHPHPPTPRTRPEGHVTKDSHEGLQGRPARLILQDPTVCLTPSPTNAGP